MMSRSRKYCAVRECGNKRSDDISLHHFPTDEFLRKRWQKLLNIEKPITKDSYVCSEHFTRDCFFYFDPEIHQRRHLKKSVLPSEKLPGRTNDRVKSPKEAKPIKDSSEGYLLTSTQPTDYYHILTTIPKSEITLNSNLSSHIDSEIATKKLTIEREITAVEVLLQLQSSMA